LSIIYWPLALGLTGAAHFRPTPLEMAPVLAGLTNRGKQAPPDDTLKKLAVINRARPANRTGRVQRPVFRLLVDGHLYGRFWLRLFPAGFGGRGRRRSITERVWRHRAKTEMATTAVQPVLICDALLQREVQGVTPKGRRDSNPLRCIPAYTHLSQVIENI
jgi:hypothetical protein